MLCRKPEYLIKPLDLTLPTRNRRDDEGRVVEVDQHTTGSSNRISTEALPVNLYQDYFYLFIHFLQFLSCLSGAAEAPPKVANKNIS